jgi:hypothetical protein
MPELNDFWIIGKSAERCLDAFQVFRGTVESGRILGGKR